MRHDWTKPLPHELTAHEIRVQLARLEETQGWLARELSVAPSTINRKMTGISKWRQSELQHMAALFDIPVSQLHQGGRSDEHDGEATAHQAVP